MNLDEPKIVRIVDVRDTRDRIEIDDRWIPVPGTGVMRPCDRCGKTHEIHVDVELSNGKRANIGSGCAKGESMDVQSRIKSAVSGVKTRSRIAAELAAATAELAEATAVRAEVDKLKPPESRLVEAGTPDRWGHRREIWSMGDANVWTIGGEGFTSERRQTLLNGWKTNRHRERTNLTMDPYYYKRRVEDLRDRLAKQDKKLRALLF